MAMFKTVPGFYDKRWVAQHWAALLGRHFLVLRPVVLVHIMYSESQSPTLSVAMWPGEDKTYIDARNQRKYVNAEQMR